MMYLDLEKTYNGVDSNAMWSFGVNGILLNVIRSLLAESEACVRVCRKEGEWFGLEAGLRIGCVMSPWLFNLFMNRVMREIRETAREIGVRLIDDKSKHN